jgi:SAM-dependent methyltransferase
MPLLSRRRQRLAQIDAPAGARLVLHVGCGPLDHYTLNERFRGPDWHELRLDVDPGVRPDIVASITDMSPVPDASVDAVYSHHNIEHVFAHEVPLALAEFFRVLRPGGEVLIATPDLQALGRDLAHRTGFTAKTLARRLTQAGFGRVQMARDDFNRVLWASAARPLA